MNRPLPVGLFAGLGVVLLAGSTGAQNTYPYLPPQYGPGYQTPLSPWLNFLRGGDPAANYFLGVVPEFQRRQDRNVFRSQIQGLQILTAPLRNPSEEREELPRTLWSTGHPTSFGNTASFFNSQGAGMAGGRPAGAGRAPASPAGRPSGPGR